MKQSPKILVVTDEPMLTVTMLTELEDRGFAVEPVKPGERRIWPHPEDIDAAIFDLHQPDDVSLRLAQKLCRAAIPLITFGGGQSFSSIRIAGAENCLSKPIDYDRLADCLFTLVSRSAAIATHTEPAHASSPEQ